MRLLKPAQDDAASSNMGPSQSGGLAAAARSSLCFQSLLGFFFNKGVRGGPRVLLNLAGLLLALIVFVKLLPHHLTESALSVLPQSVWSSLGSSPSYDTAPGGLRIVVFGENDIGTPVGMQPESDGAQSWTQALCDELQCADHISMVPSPEAAPYSISSNALYALGLDKVFNETHGKDTPGYDYSYLSETYPPQWKSSDLKDQVDRFLAMPKPPRASGETLWVFSFGLWDVWSLSSFPFDAAKQSVDAMTKDVFAQIERLYQASLDPTSIAYSEVVVPADPPAKESQKASGAAAGGPVEKREEAAAQGHEQPADAVQPQQQQAETTRPAESFRILVPRIVDPSMLPGWRDLRPDSPAVHSKAEQLRNSYSLTNAWNDGIVGALTKWVKTVDAGHKRQEEEENKKDLVGGDTTTTTAAPAPAAVSVPPPSRDGYAYNLADYLLDAILERQMRNAKLADGNGRGQGALEEGFRDVRNPCLQPLRSVAVSVATQVGVTLNLPYKKIGGDKQALVRRSKRGDDAAAQAEEGGKKNSADEDEEQRPALGYMSTAKVCEIPSDHLFYTPFALSQRAIQEVAAETADMIRHGDTVRSKLGV